ncbi:cyclophilin peptidyl-prolyl cis-trans isomerase Cyp8 [Cryomyces antarcticus]|uniref:Peptidyl-prolyl cis-trans isomerase n=1 Tax=Cryomyces antarcticus TaxID=329879 RepID=A0ABR0LZ92_9PEZI|nr:cyclophilin peptidyl-prolyl cis-trans isomerase Cyp8 [Cryomyces antarcticus]KAK5257145.1 cyclophilin peptidyl-prolyl cis-trans isomerase Cyp8 [Cryomyces antarcticus]
MLQGGDPTGTGRGGSSIWGGPFVDEFEGPMTHAERGIVSMANKGKNTNTSQFFVTYRPAKHLDRKHTIFGRVVGGLETLAALENVKTDERDKPVETCVLEDVVVFVDPFEEFMKMRSDKEREEAEKREIERMGGTEDEKMTWTGKRVRRDGAGVDDSRGAEVVGVGKYLKAQVKEQGPVTTTDETVGNWDQGVAEPVRKKVKGGFGNFDGCQPHDPSVVLENEKKR